MPKTISNDQANVKASTTFNLIWDVIPVSYDEIFENAIESFLLYTGNYYVHLNSALRGVKMSLEEAYSQFIRCIVDK